MLSEDFQTILKKVFSRYSAVSERSLEKVFEVCYAESFKKNELILQVGSIARKIHFLCSGAVISYFLDLDGNVYHKNIFLEGDVVGSTVSSLTRQPSKFALQAIEDSTVISIDYSTYRRLIRENADLNDFYIAYLEKNWVIDKERREIAIVMQKASERYQELLDKHPYLDQRIPLTYIASHLGITPTQLSRIRKSLR